MAAQLNQLEVDQRVMTSHMTATQSALILFKKKYVLVYTLALVAVHCKPKTAYTGLIIMSSM